MILRATVGGYSCTTVTPLVRVFVKCICTHVTTSTSFGCIQVFTRDAEDEGTTVPQHARRSTVQNRKRGWRSHSWGTPQKASCTNLITAEGDFKVRQNFDAAACRVVKSWKRRFRGVVSYSWLGTMFLFLLLRTTLSFN